MMVSLQAWLLNGIFRFFMKRHGDKPIDLERLRATTKRPPKRALHVPDGYRVDEIRTANGLSFDIADRTQAREKPPATVVLYIHGGGYFFGSPKTHRQIIIAMAKAFDAPAYGLDYRLAPEHPFPAAVEDAARAYRWLLEKHPNAKIVLAGDSAGGGLAIITALEARDAGLPQAAAIVGFSPWTDLAITGASIEANGRSCAMFTPKGMRAGASLYLAGADPLDPRASPLYANPSGLPPMLLFASRHEILLDDTVRFAERAKTAGVKVEVVLRDRLPHVWPIFLRLLPEGREALEMVTDFARRITAAPSTQPTAFLADRSTFSN
jgi:epsilon-lactone hydrolase